MTTLTKTPNNYTQTTGGNYRTFTNLNNLKNTSAGSYARSAHTIGSKSVHPNRPSTVSVFNFKFNIPSEAVVKKIVVHYRHAKRCGTPAEDIPFSCDKYNPNIPAPTISVLNTNLSGKGQAPPKTGSHQTLTFTGMWDASVVNSSSFGVKINYPSNTNNNYGFVLISYLYLSIDYYVPSFTLKAGGANPDKVYNHSEYNLVADLSDANLTERTTSVTISVPAGLTFKDWSGSGSLERPQANMLVWTPDMRREALLSRADNSYSRGALFTFDVDISFSGSSTSVTRDFTLAMVGSTSPLTHTATIYKELPVEDEGDTGEQSYEYDTESEVLPEVAKVVINEEFEYTLIVDDATLNSMATAMYERSSTSLTFEEFYNRYFLYSEILFTKQNYGAPYIISDNGLINRYDEYTGWTNYMDSTGHLHNFIANGKTHTLQLKGIELGVDKIWAIHRDNVNNVYTPFVYWSFEIIPAKSSLTTPFYTKLELSSEEQDRLGDGFVYIAQSDLELNTNESYVRDWYNNFRLGVFNNKIEANCSTYYLQASTDSTLDGEIRLSARNDITDGYIIIDTNTPVKLTANGNEYQLADGIPFTMDLFEEYVMPVTFAKICWEERIYDGDENPDSYHYETICMTEDNVVLTIKQYTSDDTLVDTLNYHINFNAEADMSLTEMETDSTDYDNLTDTEIFENAEYWSSKIAGLNTSVSVETEFTYNKNYPLYVIITGDYPEGDPTNNTLDFTEPCIVEKDQFTKRLSNGVYPEPIESLISDEDTSELTLTSFGVSDTVVFYDFPLEDNYGTDTNRAVRGIEIRGNIEQSDRLILYAKLKSPTGESRQRSIVINDYDTNVDSSNSFSIGGNGDLWGFNTLDIKNLENWEAELTVSNNLEETDSNINFGDIQLIFYIETVEDQPITAYIEGEDIRYYGVFLKTVNIPEGLETDTDYLTVDGSDINDAYRQNITSKTIEIEFELGDNCDLEANTLSRRELAKLLVNDRDEYNRPIPKRIEFSHYPDVYWEYVMEEAIDDKIEISSYVDGKIKLKIPAGTSYDKEPTTTSNTGYINGLATVNPVILVKPTDENISIIETGTGQEFHIGYSGEWNDKILEIDCENRIAWLKTSEDDTDPVNLNKYVDYNSDWFRLKGEYNFTGVNCTVLTIDYQERW